MRRSWPVSAATRGRTESARRAACRRSAESAWRAARRYTARGAIEAAWRLLPKAHVVLLGNTRRYARIDRYRPPTPSAIAARQPPNATGVALLCAIACVQRPCPSAAKPRVIPHVGQSRWKIACIGHRGVIATRPEARSSGVTINDPTITLANAAISTPHAMAPTRMSRRTRRISSSPRCTRPRYTGPGSVVFPNHPKQRNGPPSCLTTSNARQATRTRTRHGGPPKVLRMQPFPVWVSVLRCCLLRVFSATSLRRPSGQLKRARGQVPRETLRGSGRMQGSPRRRAPWPSNRRAFPGACLPAAGLLHRLPAGAAAHEAPTASRSHLAPSPAHAALPIPHPPVRYRPALPALPPSD